MKEFDEWYPDDSLLSECCGVPFNEDIGLCPMCKDHCVGIRYDEDGNEIQSEKL